MVRILESQLLLFTYVLSKWVKGAIDKKANGVLRDAPRVKNPGGAGSNVARGGVPPPPGGAF